jgi:hypothetical protein
MSQTTVYTCDGPACLESSEEADDSTLTETGWLTVEHGDDEFENTSHFCSTVCLGAWASETSAKEPA